MISSRIYNSIPDATVVFSVILGYLLDRNIPVVTIIPFPASLLGWLLVVAGAGLAIYIFTIWRSNHTSSNPDGIPSAFITQGLYALSRNPFYLSYLIVTIGAACILGSLTAFAAPIICFVVLDVVIIPLEERNMQKKFGEKYTRYKQVMRKWI